MLSKLFKSLKYLLNLFLLISTTIAALFAAGHFNLITFYKPFIVTSGSMEPSIPTGSVVLVFPKIFGYMIGDIITYQVGKTTTTHRVHALKMQDDQLVYQTKGDANSDPDSIPVNPVQVIGSVNLTLPYIGYAANFIQTPQGFILLVIVPATIIIYEEFKNLFRELALVTQKLLRFRSRDRVASGQDLPGSIALKKESPNAYFGFEPTESVFDDSASSSRRQRSVPTSGIFVINGFRTRLLRAFTGMTKPFSLKLTLSSSKNPNPKTNIQISDNLKPITENRFGFNYRYIFLPAVAGLFITLAASNAFFSDTDSSTQNVLGAADSYGEQLSHLYLDSTGENYTCPGGTTTTETRLGVIITKLQHSTANITIKIQNAQPNTTYDLWINQHPGACPLAEPTQTTIFTTDNSGNATSTTNTSILPGASVMWLSLTGPGQTLRSTTINL